MSYIDIIKDKARMDRKTIVLPETTDKRTLIAAAQIIQEGITLCFFGRDQHLQDNIDQIHITHNCFIKVLRAFICLHDLVVCIDQ